MCQLSSVPRICHGQVYYGCKNRAGICCVVMTGLPLLNGQQMEQN
jgi:hypothetical protein